MDATRSWARIACLAAGCAAAAAAARADTVRLRNGGFVEGIVLSRTATEVVVEIGTGTMRMPASMVREIVPSTAMENAALRDGWARRHFLHRRFVPEGMHDLAEAFREVMGKHDQAVQARRGIENGRRREEELRREIEETQTAHARRSAALRALDPAQDVERYNAAVREVNALNAELTLGRQALAELAESRSAGMSRVSEYLKTLASFQKLLTARAREVSGEPSDGKRRAFVERISRETANLGTEIARVVVSAAEWKGGRLVTAEVNGAEEGRFILDTGASLMSITAAFALRLGLDAEEGAEVELRMADGREVPARAVVLDSVSLGSARAERVDAVILPDAPSRDADGLLGMSFLNRFVLRLDGATGELTLEEFSP